MRIKTREHDGVTVVEVSGTATKADAAKICSALERALASTKGCVLSLQHAKEIRAEAMVSLNHERTMAALDEKLVAVVTPSSARARGMTKNANPHGLCHSEAEAVGMVKDK
jgi:uncharacterized protein YrrD